MGGEKPPLPANDNETEREIAEKEQYLSSLGEELALNKEIQDRKVKVLDAIIAAEEYLQRPAIGRVTAVELHTKAANQLETLAKLRLTSRDSFVLDPEFDSFIQRVESLRVKIDALP